MKTKSVPIFLRAHTEVVGSKKELKKEPVDQELNSSVQPHTENNWAQYALVIDCETTTDERQALVFGAYRFCETGDDGVYSCIEEGFFYADELPDTDPNAISILNNYVKDNQAETTDGFDKRMRLYSRSDFMRNVFWKAAYEADAAVVCFNAPFDLSRLAVGCRPARRRNEGWSLIMFRDKDPKTGDLREDPFKQRIKINPKDSKAAFIRFAGVSIRRKKTKRRIIPYKPGRFLDLRTLGWALRNKSYNLEEACKDFAGLEKLNYEPTGLLSIEEINYCRQDVRCTASILNGMRREFDKHPIGLAPERAFSPASIAKAYLMVMGLAPPLLKFPVGPSVLGIAMQAYYGGRAECHVRHATVPVVHTDFRSEYPTVNSLMGLWKFLTAREIKIQDATEQIRTLLNEGSLDHCFDPSFWKGLTFFGLIKPDDSVLPVRTVYNGRTTNIGINRLTSRKPIWYAGPDLVTSTLISGRPPKLLRAIRLTPGEPQDDLRRTNLRGMVSIDPVSEDFFQRVVEAREQTRSDNSLPDREAAALSHFLKILANAGSYGLFVEVNPDEFGVDRKTGKPARRKIRVFSGETEFEQTSPIAELEGRWYCSLFGALITSAGRLLLSMLERCVTDQGGSYLMCDTDSLAIVSTQRGGFIPSGGEVYQIDKQQAIQALSWKEVENIVERFERLNPYSQKLVQGILKIEKVNFDEAGEQIEIFGYSISSKRYAFFIRKSDGTVQIEKASAHGLGFLYPPKPGFNKKVSAPTWVVEAWQWILHQSLGISCEEPEWFSLPAMMRLAITTPKVLEKLQERQRHLPYRDRAKPFNFVLSPILDRITGCPVGVDPDQFTLIAPFTKDSSRWPKKRWINIYDGKPYRLASNDRGLPHEVTPKTYGDLVKEFIWHPESKSFGSEGEQCSRSTRGLLRRTAVEADIFRFIGKETDRRWEQGEDFSLLEQKIQEYRPGETEKLGRNPELQQHLGLHTIRAVAKASGVSEGTVKAARKGKRIRRANARKLWEFVRTPNRGI
jgi:hypothetical protein